MEEIATLKSEKINNIQGVEVNNNIYLDELKNDLKASERRNLDLTEEINNLKSVNASVKEELDNLRIQLDAANNSQKPTDNSMFDKEKGSTTSTRKECEFCLKSVSKKNFSRHIFICKNGTGEKAKCQFCDKSVTKNNFARHLKSHR